MKTLRPHQTKNKKIVVIIGGGFAGLNAAKALADRDDLYVILIDQKNHHLFQPLLYQVATAGLNDSDIAIPIRALFSNHKNVEVHWGRVDGVDLDRRTIRSNEKDLEMEYDYLIIAGGASHSYFAHPEWEPYAPGLKTVEQATEIRRRIFSAFEHAENELDPLRQRTLLNFVVVGGGPTGVELAGAIAELSRRVLVNDFKRIDPTRAQVTLLEAGPRLVPAFSEDLSEHTRKDLTELGVDVRMNCRVDNINADGVRFGSHFVASHNVFWAAGVQGAALEIHPPLARDRQARIPVTSQLTIPGYNNVFVVGDMAAIPLGDQQFVPGLAPAAIQAGRHAARCIIASITKRPCPDFQYNDKGIMATIGRSRAIAQTGRWKMTGHLAWFAWLMIHVLTLIGFRNRVSVMFEWFWSYLFSKRGARLITDRDWKLRETEESPR